MTQNNKMTLSEVIKRNEEKFEKEIKPVADVEVRNGEWLVSQEEVKSFLRSSQESIVEWVREWAEKNKREPDCSENEKEECTPTCGFNNALSDLLQELTK